ncbi:hypothetical protein [Halodesulfovibrio aestuarii]|uniref:hypothetical protein n=1 Tax=Halodesulfovibrio aestuarii TaxID=126333 RepID=UPI003D335BA2
MKLVPLHIEITEEHPAYRWAKSQSDSVNAIGHIGTHLDCYTTEPTKDTYEVDVVVFDCTKAMPTAAQFAESDLIGKAVVFYTCVLNSAGYGSDVYGKSKTFLTQKALDALLIRKPAFILIDACGIGNHGEEHQRFDKQCERQNCFVIENVLLSEEIVKSLRRIRIAVDLESPSTGKCCQVWGECTSK